MSRRDRQRAELQQLCHAGALARAVDLAFTYFADHGPDQEILDALAAQLDRRAATPALRRRFDELRQRR